jgi:exodeoxyribonuclease VII large subunit
MTQRLPFNPEHMAAKPAPGPPPPAKPADAPWTVSQLAGRISGALDLGLPAKLRVIGEVSNFRDRTHWYFDLKDTEAVVSCALFATAARKSRFTPKNGHEVIATGRVEFWNKAGKVSLIVEKLEPVGAGALELAYQALCEEIRALGWFEQARKRPIPGFPRRIAVVTSRSGAALQDVLDTMRRRCPAVDVTIIDVRVQGDGAASEVARALRWLGEHRARLGIEAVLVTRGGGSMEDLWAFNERIVAEAIVNSPIPIVAAIGHETDTTIAELVADLRCATPTQAAMRLTPDRRALVEQLDSTAARLRTLVRRALHERRSRILQIARHPFVADPGALVDRERRHVETLVKHARSAIGARVRSAAHSVERLAGRLEAHRPAALQARRAATLQTATARLTAAMRRRLELVSIEPFATRLDASWDARWEREDARLQSLARQLAAVGPASVLRRGFSYTMREDGSILRSPDHVRPGDPLLTRLAEGQVRSVVQPDGHAPPAAPTPEEVIQTATRTTPRRKKAIPRDQMDLFHPPR